MLFSLKGGLNSYAASRSLSNLKPGVFPSSLWSLPCGTWQQLFLDASESGVMGKHQSPVLAAARRKQSTSSKPTKIASQAAHSKSEQELQQELEELTATYQEHSRLYYSGQEQLSDDAFDAIKAKLRMVEDAWEEVMGKPLAFRASEQVGASIATLDVPALSEPQSKDTAPWGALQTVQHALPMLSLAARNSRQEVKHWHDVSLRNNLQKLTELFSPKGLAWVIEPKIDGLAVSASYCDGRLIRLATRGDGSIGQDVTRHAQNIKGLPMQLLPPLAPTTSTAPPAISAGALLPADTSSAYGNNSGSKWGKGRNRQAVKQQHQQLGEQVDLHGEPEKVPFMLEVRGEVYMSKADFLAFLSGNKGSDGATRSNSGKRSAGHGNEGGSVSSPAMGVGSNPRNTAAGVLRSQNPAQSVATQLSFLAYQLLCHPGSQHRSCGEEQQPLHVVRSQYDSLRCLAKAGFEVSQDAVRCDNFEAALDAAEAWMAKRDQLKYEVDGSVLKLDDQEIVGQLGSRHSDPLWAVAWKFPPMQTTTRVIDIMVTIGKQGKVTPIATLEPVNIGGVVVKHANLGNAMLVTEMGLHLGDLVVLVRANDVIPKVEGVVPGQKRKPGSQPWQPPNQCPSCRGPLVLESRNLMCRNPQCSAKSTKQVEAFAKICLEGSKLAGKSIQALAGAGVVKTIPDLYFMTSEDLLRLPSWGPKKVLSVMDSIAHSRVHLSLQQLLQGLAIDGVGRNTASVLAQHYTSLRHLQRDAESGHVAGMCGKYLERCVAWFACPENKTLINKLAEASIACVEGGPGHSKPDPSTLQPAACRDGGDGATVLEASGSEVAVNMDGPFKGECFVITGTCETGARHEVACMLERLGAVVEPRMTSRTTKMVIGEVNSRSGKPSYSLAKVETARRKGVEIMTEKELLELMSGPRS